MINGGCRHRSPPVDWIPWASGVWNRIPFAVHCCEFESNSCICVRVHDPTSCCGKCAENKQRFVPISVPGSSGGYLRVAEVIQEIAVLVVLDDCSFWNCYDW